MNNSIKNIIKGIVYGISTIGCIFIAIGLLASPGLLMCIACFAALLSMNWVILTAHERTMKTARWKNKIFTGGFSTWFIILVGGPIACILLLAIAIAVGLKLTAFLLLIASVLWVFNKFVFVE